MIAVSYYSKRVLNKASLYAFIFLFIAAFSNQFVQAQDRVGKRAAQEQTIQKTTLSETALSRMTDAITAKRAEKSGAGNGFKQSSAAQQLKASVENNLSASAADVAYGSSYFDTVTGDDFSFPEDTHDYCRASFNSDTALSDYYLNANLDPGETLVATLTWSTQADYDLYIFDVEGYPVGDVDADFDGASGIDLQNVGSVLEENATIVHDRGAAGNEFVVVVDRFRGAADNELIVNLSGNDGVFAVMEYVAADNLTYLNTDANATVGPLTNGITIDAATAENFSAQFNTDGCAQSVVFTLIDENGDPVLDDMGNPAIVDSSLPFSAFGDDAGDFNGATLLPGTYTVVATPYSQADGQGVSASPQEAIFTVVGTEVSVDNFSLINAETDEAIPAFDPIAEGSVIDLVALSNQGIDINRLNIQANVTDPQGLIDEVLTDLFVTLLSGDIVGLQNGDGVADYSVYGDDNAGDFFDENLSLGTYALSGAPIIGGDTLDAAIVNFTVIGPRIGSYTLIDAVTELPIDGSGGTPDFDPILEGAVIDMNLIGTDSVNVRANTIDYLTPAIESIKFDLKNGEVTVVDPIESFRPYALFGDPTNRDLTDDDPALDYRAWPGLNTTFVLDGQPYGLNGATGALYGPLTLNFSMINAAASQIGDLPNQPELLANYPNPFNPVTAIRFSLPDEVPVRLEVYDMLGRVVKLLVEGTLKSGYHEVTFEAANLSSGMYMYRLETPTGVQVRPMTLLK